MSGFNGSVFLSALPFIMTAMVCVQGVNGQTKVIPVTYHDFNASHSDFESPNCMGGVGMV